MTKKQNAIKSRINLIAAGLKLGFKQIPFLLVFENKGVLNHYGSSNMDQWFSSELSLDAKESLKSKMLCDIKEHCRCSLPDLENNTSGSTSEIQMNVDKCAQAIYESLTRDRHPSGTPLLPYPLDMMNIKQKASYVRVLIEDEATKDNVTFEYGMTSWRPDFWLDDEWNWSNLKQSIFLMTESSYNGKGSWSDFLSNTIRSVFNQRGLDTETHVIDPGTNKICKKRKRLDKSFDSVTVGCHADRISMGNSDPTFAAPINNDQLLKNYSSFDYYSCMPHLLPFKVRCVQE